MGLVECSDKCCCLFPYSTAVLKVMRVSQLEMDLPYLAAKGGEIGQFLTRLKEVGVELPLGVTPRDLVSAGLISPLFRIPVPRRYFAGWTDYPRVDTHHEIEEEDVGIDNLYFAAAGAGTLYAMDDDPKGNWFVHPFDRHSGMSAATISPWRSAPISTDIRSFRHRRRYRIYPWIDYFCYWQAYQLAEAVTAGSLVVPATVMRSRNAARRIGRSWAQYAKWSESNVARVHGEWAKRAELFEWLARYRAMRSALSFRNRLWPPVRKGRRWRLPHSVEVLTGALSVTEVSLETAIEKVLLPLLTQWRLDRPESDEKVRGNLQKDLLCALEWLLIISGRKIDYYYDLWAHSRQNPPLEEAFPLRLWVGESYFCKHFGAVRGAYYRSLPDGLRFRAESLKPLARRLRNRTRLAVDWMSAYKRLHESLRPDDSPDWAGIKEQETLRHFLLLTLLSEKMLLSLMLSRGGRGSKAPGFQKLICVCVKNLERRDRRLRGTWGFIKANWNYTDLRQMPVDPFLQIEGLSIPGTSEQIGLAKAVLGFAAARNYFAHHYYHDQKLIGSASGAAAASAVIVATLFLSASWLGGRRLWG